MMKSAPVLTRHPAQGGFVRVRVQCTVCDAANDQHARELEDGTLQPDPWATSTFIGYRTLDDGRIVCSDLCFRSANTPTSHFSLDASRFPNDPRLNVGTASSLAVNGVTTVGKVRVRGVESAPQPGDFELQQRRTHSAQCPCGVKSEVHQSRLGDGPWAPEALTTLAALGWFASGKRLYCGKICSAKHAGVLSPSPLSAVIELNDATYQKHHVPMRDRVAARPVSTVAPNGVSLASLDGDEPKRAKSSRAR